MTGLEPIHAMIDRLADCASAAAVREGLILARDGLAAFDAAGVGIDPARYQAIAAALEKLPTPVKMSRLFQLDLVKPAAEATLGSDVLADLIRGVEILHGMSGRPAGDSLAEFRADFSERDGERMIPLTEVLDEETGIGFERSSSPEAEGGPLLAGVAFPTASQQTVGWSARQQFLFHKLTEAVATGARQIALSPDDLKQLATPDPLPPPDAISVVASVAAKSQDELQQGNYTLCLLGIGGPSGRGCWDVFVTAMRGSRNS